MNYQISNIPGTRGYLKKANIFTVSRKFKQTESERLVSRLKCEIRLGKFHAGESFPVPEQLAEMTGQPLDVCLDAISALLGDGVIMQRCDGQLYVSSRSSAGNKRRRLTRIFGY